MDSAPRSCWTIQWSILYRIYKINSVYKCSTLDKDSHDRKWLPQYSVADCKL